MCVLVLPSDVGRRVMYAAAPRVYVESMLERGWKPLGWVRSIESAVTKVTRIQKTMHSHTP